MLNCCTKSLTTVPDITIYMNCDTILAINVQMFDLGENDEFIFAIKNYDYIDSGYVFLFRARKTDIDDNGEVIFKITPEASKKLKPGAFYNFAVLLDAFDITKETEYKKLTNNGCINIEYGAHDLALAEDTDVQIFNEIAGMRLELVDDIISGGTEEVIGARIECISQG